MTPPEICVYDACVLYSSMLRHLLVELGVAQLCRPRWTERIHWEWMSAVLETRPDVLESNLEETRRLMNAFVEDSLVSGYEADAVDVFLPDPSDQHVLAAAMHCGAQTIVTFNLRHFPASVEEATNVRAVHPDEFLLRLLASRPTAFCRVVRTVRSELRRPPKTVAEYLATMTSRGLAETAAALEKYAAEL